MVEQPYPTLDETCDAYAAHVAPGKVELYRQLGFLAVMGERSGARFSLQRRGQQHARHARHQARGASQRE